MSARRRLVGTLTAVLAALALTAAPTGAHPLGNFSISHYAGIELNADGVRVRYVIDMAEIPTFQEIQEHALVAEPGHPSVAPWVARMAESLGRGLRLDVGGRRLALAPGTTEILFPPGAGGALSDYPVDLLNSPPQDVEARVTFTRTSVAGAPVTPAPPIGLQPNRQASSASRFADLVTRRDQGAGLVAMTLMVAVVLGAFHALEPGHGKTVVAAYLVGSRGTAWHALVLGIVVTASHTAGVYLLGGVTFYASQYVVPERLYPWLSLFSGLTIAGLGAVMFLRRFAGGASGHDHAHGGHDHAHAPVSLRALVALGVSGGIIPCPAALVVLLSALSIHRVGFGLVLIVAFSIGLAAVLVIIGVLMVYASRLMSRFREDGPWINRWLPLTSSAVMALLGLGIAIQAMVPWIPR